MRTNISHTSSSILSCWLRSLVIYNNIRLWLRSNPHRGLRPFLISFWFHVVQHIVVWLFFYWFLNEWLDLIFGCIGDIIVTHDILLYLLYFCSWSNHWKLPFWLLVSSFQKFPVSLRAIRCFLLIWFLKEERILWTLASSL